MATTVQVGTRIRATADMPYNDNRGRGIHHIVRIIEVTYVDQYRAEYRTVEVLEESGRPDWNPDPMNMSGGFRVDLLSQITRFEAL